MKLLINASMLGEKPSGLGVYSENCIRGLSKKINSTLISSKEFSLDAAVEIQPPRNISIGSGMLAALRRIIWLKKTEIDPVRLIYSPTHHGFPSHTNQIITIHDLICLKFPGQHIFQFLYFKFILPGTIKNCRAIFTVSNASKKEIALTYSYPEEKIYVISNGVDTSIFRESGIKKYTDPFLLMVGARYPHKNVEEVLANSIFWSEKYRLVITSCHGRYKKKLQAIIADKKIENRVVFLDYVQFDELVGLYQNCRALIYPSKLEGFGIPPLEAIACGSPVIASEIPVHKEILAGAAFFVKLGEPLSWKQAFDALEKPDEIKKKLSAGKKRLSVYTWSNAVEVLAKSLLQVEPRLQIKAVLPRK
jgi:glycosyltransferase involved in cell wall biosynthesis